ncbi:MAG: PTS system mannose/fructose/sorbose family transporter subunit IID [Faecousia sp.]
MTMNSENLTPVEQEEKLNKKDLWRIFFRSCQLDASWNYERQQNLGYSYGISAAISKIYKKDPEKKKQALKRSLEFMAVTPQLSAMLMGINVAMEEENAKNPDFDENSINSVKTSLMGPLAGIGDALIPGTLRIIAASIAISFAAQGSILAPFLYLLIFNIPGFTIQYLGLKYGYQFGTSFITKISKSGIMEKISYAAGIVGLMVIGGMVATQIWLDLPIMVGTGDVATPLMTYLDQIMPCLIPLGCFGGMYYLLGKKVKTTTILMGLVAVCVALCFVASII